VSLTATSALSASLISTDEMNRTKYTVVGNKSDDSCIQLDLTKMGAMVVQVGANEGQQLEIEIPALNAVNLGIDHLDLTTEKSATESINVVAKAIDQLSSVRARIGAYANRLEHTISNLDTTEENMTSSYSRIMDVDVAEEMTEYTSVQVLVQAATSVLAQANERPQQVLQLLQ
jgi:flagellin